MDLGTRIAAWRQSKGWTQRQLAGRIGITVAAVCQWEKTDSKYHSNPSQENLTKLVDALGLTMERFYGRVPRAKRAAA